ncbi:MAG: histidine kinase N-terminal 7TM domain-containing protein, partial [Candidatus Pacebacteria bacterium]|nr:histidine kinase N-terminal 7TM domain-containing protein [Candidatus Paceibacterota bacterium]
MGILEFTILFAAIFNLGAGIFVYSRGRLKKINLLFALSGLITSSWVFSNFMTGMQPNHFWLKSAYALGALVPVSDLIWVLVLCDKKITKITNILLITTGLFFFGASYINNLILTDIKKVYLGGFEGGTGFLYPLYSAYMIAISLVVVYNLLLKFYKSQGTEKIQISYILIGGILYISSVLIVSFILPLFKILDFIPLDSPSSLFLLFFTALAITRYHLFQIKIILTEALVVSMAIILTILPFLMPSGSLKILTSIALGLFLIFGFLLIKATHAEVRRKEEAERL